jgi:hypothetical protein
MCAYEYKTGRQNTRARRAARMLGLISRQRIINLPSSSFIELHSFITHSRHLFHHPDFDFGPSPPEISQKAGNGVRI